MTLSYNHFNTSVSAAILLLLALLLSPPAVKAQSISSIDAYQGDGFYVGVNVHLSGSASHFPARISINWGDGTSNWTRAQSTSKNVGYLWKTYANCGVKSLSLSVTFNDGATSSRSKSFTVACPPAQEPEGGPLTCDIQIAPGTFSCRHVPNYFLENERAANRAHAERLRREERGDFTPVSIFDFGYRCPDAMGRCPTAWIPEPSREHGGTSGLSNPDRFDKTESTSRPGAFVQRINAAGIGVAWIIEEHPIDAIDIWGPGAEEGGEVCFEGTEGRLVYLDARTSPRAQSILSTYVKGDNICGMMPGPGSVVYLPPEG